MYARLLLHICLCFPSCVVAEVSQEPEKTDKPILSRSQTSTGRLAEAEDTDFLLDCRRHSEINIKAVTA